MAKKGVYTAFVDVHKSSLAMSIMEGKPIATDYLWGKHHLIQSGSSIVHVFAMGESITVPEMQGLIDKWAAGGFRNLIDKQ